MSALTDILLQLAYIPSKTEFIQLLKRLPAAPKEKKYVFIDFCKEFNYELTQRDVEEFYPHEAG
jgi:hypothetical protein